MTTCVWAEEIVPCPSWKGFPITSHAAQAMTSVRGTIVFAIRLLAAGLLLAAHTAAAQDAALVKTEFVFERAPHAQCHASTIAATDGGLVAAWFGGTREKDPDVGIWLARDDGSGWSAPVEVANGVQDTTTRYPTWNPVLFQPADGPLLLFYKAGPDPVSWWGMLMTSDDGGRTWSPPRRLPEGVIGPVKNKPVQLANGDLLAPSSTEHDGWRVHFDRTDDLGETWTQIGPIDDGEGFDAIQPSILQHGDGRLQVLCRSKSGRIVESWSDDGGWTWSPLAATSLPNPNSGTDAVTLEDGRHLLVYNPTTVPEGEWGGPRSPLGVAVSDDGEHWQAAFVLEDEPGEYSYPAVIQTSDGLVHVTYTWRRERIKHVVLDPDQFDLRPMPDGAWPD